MFDAETLGLLKEQSNYTFQIGAVDSEGNVINRLISDRVITKAIQQLTGITQADIIAKGQSLETVMNEFYNWLYDPNQKNKTIVGHNIQFDLGHIKKDFELLGLNYD